MSEITQTAEWTRTSSGDHFTLSKTGNGRVYLRGTTAAAVEIVGLSLEGEEAEELYEHLLFVFGEEPMTQPLPFDPECPHCGWPHAMKNPWDALVCRCGLELWWMFDTERQFFRLVRMGQRRQVEDNGRLVRYHHPAAIKFVCAIDNAITGVKAKRTARAQRGSETSEPYDEALWQEGAEL